MRETRLYYKGAHQQAYERFETDRLAADELQGVFDNRRLRGVDHDRECDLRVEPRDDLPHVLRLIAADVRGAHIDHVRPFF